MGRLIQGYWDCTYCGHKAIKADVENTKCPTCGKMRGEGVRFYLIDKNEVANKETVEKAGKSANWVCEYCNGYNYTSDSTCKHCGSDRRESKEDYFSSQRKIQNKQELNKGSTAPVRDFPSEIHNIREKSHKNRTKLMTWAIITLVAALVIGGLTWLLIPKTQQVTVTELSWERSIAVEELKTFNESDWSLPAEARLTRSATEFSHYDKVLDHYETVSEQVQKQRISGYETVVTGHRDLGNGLFEEITEQRAVYETYWETETKQQPVYRDEPVYRTKYYYEIDRWTHTRNVVTSGKNKDVYWGDVELADKERLGKRSEWYKAVAINKKGKQNTYNFEYSEWMRLEADRSYMLKVSIGNNASIIE